MAATKTKQPERKSPEYRDMESEAINLFQHLNFQIAKEVKELETNFNIARNLACSTWKDDFIGRLSPTQIHPERTDLLKENFDLLREELSYRRYLLIKAFLPLVGGKVSTGGSIPGEMGASGRKIRMSLEYPFSLEDQQCYFGWEKEVRKVAKAKAKEKLDKQLAREAKRLEQEKQCSAPSTTNSKSKLPRKNRKENMSSKRTTIPKHS